uniref:Uncharacterized protein n=1 Tax=Anopheles atroparvus TaxID=41427 RepID=A0A182J5A8_ANOAO
MSSGMASFVELGGVPLTIISTDDTSDWSGGRRMMKVCSRGLVGLKEKKKKKKPTPTCKQGKKEVRVSVTRSCSIIRRNGDLGLDCASTPPLFPVDGGFVNTRCTVATVTLHSAEHGVPGARTPLGVVPVNSINQPPISHMGVCTEERPVMHWHQNARFLGPPRERSPDLSNACQLNSNNNNIVNHRTCISCTDTCEHSLKASGGGGGSLLGVNHIYADSCHSFESPDRLIADRPNYFADLNRSDCSDSSSVLNSCIQLKSEPPGGPSSPESSNELPPTGLDECAGCDMPIQDRFYLSAVERKWHASCLQCCICRQTLEGANSCFSRDGNIYCKTDYYSSVRTEWDAVRFSLAESL